MRIPERGRYHGPEFQAKRIGRCIYLSGFIVQCCFEGSWPAPTGAANARFRLHFFLKVYGQTTCTKLLTYIFDASFEGKMVIYVTKIYTIYIINFGVAGHFDEQSETRRDGAI